MKSLDTNIIVRFLVNDDQVQGEKVKSIFLDAEKKGGTFFVATAVLLETLYVLGSVYGFSRDEILKALESMLAMRVLAFENTDAVHDLIIEGHKERIDLEDLLIALVSRDAGCETTLTFDKKAARSDLFELIR